MEYCLGQTSAGAGKRVWHLIILDKSEKRGSGKRSGTPQGVPDHSPGLRRTGATPGRRFCLKYCPERAAQTTVITDFAQPFPGCRQRVSLPGVGAKRANPGLCCQALSGAFPNGNLQIWDFLPVCQEGWLRKKPVFSSGSTVPMGLTPRWSQPGNKLPGHNLVVPDGTYASELQPCAGKRRA